MPPVSGATLPIAIVKLAGACAFLSSLQLELQATAAIATKPKWERIMAASGSGHSAKSRLIMRTAHGAVNLTRRFRRRGKRPPAPSDKPATPACLDEFRLLDRQDVFREGLRIVIPDGPVRRHRDGTPYAGRALFDLLHEIGLGVLSGLVLGRHFLVRRADQFLVDRMAAQAGFFLQQLLRVGGERGAARKSEDSGCR